MKINEHNKLTAETNGILWEVRTPMTLSLVNGEKGHQYPIHDEQGNLYALEGDELSVTFDVEKVDKIAYRINGQVYCVPIVDKRFEVSPNEETSFLLLELAFKLHADTEEQAYMKLHEMLCNNKSIILDFKIFDFKQGKCCDTDILVYDLSGMYLGTEV